MSAITNCSPHTKKLIELIERHDASDPFTSEREVWDDIASIAESGFDGTDDGLLGKLIIDGLFDLLLQVLSDHNIPRDGIESHLASMEPPRSVRVSHILAS